MWGPTQNLVSNGLAVLTFIEYKRTDRQTNKHQDRQTDKQSMYTFINFFEFFLSSDLRNKSFYFVPANFSFCPIALFGFQIHWEKNMIITPNS